MEMHVIYTSYKPLLLSISYRMLGSLTDAEDMVQDIFVTLQRVPVEDVRHVKAYLVKMVTNRCLNELKSASKQREVYVGPWLPEPDIEAVRAPITPEERVVQDETVSFAMLVLLQELSPVERAVFVLRDVLAYDYKEMAEMLDKSEANCRKIYSRIKPKLDRLPEADRRDTGHRLPAGSDRFAGAFLQAARTGDFKPFVQLLVEDAVLVSDGGGKVRAAIYPILGRERILAFLEGIHGKGSLADELRPVRINGDAGLLLIRNGAPRMALCFRQDAGRAQALDALYLISNPDKLRRVRV